MLDSSTWLKGLPLVGWPGLARSTLASLLSAAPTSGGAARQALVLDRRFVRPLRALGHTVVLASAGEEPAAGVDLVCATVLGGDLIGTLRRYAGWLAPGGMIVARGPIRERQRLAAAFLHAGLVDIRQVRSGRGYLTAGTIP